MCGVYYPGHLLINVLLCFEKNSAQKCMGPSLLYKITENFITQKAIVISLKIIQKLVLGSLSDLGYRLETERRKCSLYYFVPILF